MGPENGIDPTGYTLYLDGEPIERTETLPEITVDADAPEKGKLLADLSLELTFILFSE